MCSKATPQTTTQPFWLDLYDSQIFPPNGQVKTVLDDWWETSYKSITQQDHLFQKVDKTTFIKEMTAIRLEMLAFAFAESCDNITYRVQQGLYTLKYLDETNKIELWTIMGEYNQAIAQSASMDKNFKPTNPTILNQLRKETFDKWASGVDDPSKPTSTEKLMLICVARVANRFGAGVKKNDCVLIRRLGVRFAARSGCEVGLNIKALNQIATFIFGFYKGAQGALKG